MIAVSRIKQKLHFFWYSTPSTVLLIHLKPSVNLLQVFLHKRPGLRGLLMLFFQHSIITKPIIMGYKFKIYVVLNTVYSTAPGKSSNLHIEL